MHGLPLRALRRKSIKAQLKTKTDTELCFTCHKAERAQGDAHVAPPGSRRQDGLRELP